MHLRRNSYSRDRDGNLVGIICPGRIRPNEVAAHVTTEQVLEYNIYMMASVAFELAELSRQTGTVVRITRIIDLDGLSMRHASNNMIRFIRSNLAVAQSHFVEFMAHAIVINAPAAFTIIWKMIKPLLHERTVKKVVITGATYAVSLVPLECACLLARAEIGDGVGRVRSLHCAGGDTQVPQRHL